MKTYKVKVNNKEYLVELEEVDAKEKVAGQQASSEASVAPTSAEGETVNAPLQGSIFKILKQAGDTVDAGEPVLIIEAMKMENEIVAPRQGKITGVFVKTGQQVDTNAPLFSLI